MLYYAHVQYREGISGLPIFSVLSQSILFTTSMLHIVLFISCQFMLFDYNIIKY
jgi:hypothetical protein